MAKSNIPWELFWERYYPENRFHGAIDMTNIHSNQEYASAMNAFFDTLFTVTFDDIKNLSSEELNCVPMGFLADWIHCNSAYYAEEMNFLDELQKKREEYKKSRQNDQYKRVREYMKEHTVFTSHEVQEALSISHDTFLGIAYNLVIQGRVRYQNGQYIVKNE